MIQTVIKRIVVWIPTRPLHLFFPPRIVVAADVFVGDGDQFVANNIPVVIKDEFIIAEESHGIDSHRVCA